MQRHSRVFVANTLGNMDDVRGASLFWNERHPAEGEDENARRIGGVIDKHECRSILHVHPDEVANMIVGDPVSKVRFFKPLPYERLNDLHVVDVELYHGSIIAAAATPRWAAPTLPRWVPVGESLAERGTTPSVWSAVSSASTGV